MLVNGIPARATYLCNQPCCYQSDAGEGEALRRLQRQLEQAQRDLQQAEYERNYDAVMRLRYHIIPQLEKRIQRLGQQDRDQVQELAQSYLSPDADTSCSKEIRTTLTSRRTRRSHLILPFM